jgi:hypothetical protein
MAWQAHAPARRTAGALSWLLRFLGWSTLLAIPAVAVSHAYQGILTGAATALFGAFGLSIEVVDLEMMAPVDLALFTAMVLAGRRAPAARGRRALLAGIPALVAVEIATITLGMALVLATGTRGFETSMRLLHYLIGTVPWIAAPVAWWLLLGPYETSPGLRRRLGGGAP